MNARKGRKRTSEQERCAELERMKRQKSPEKVRSLEKAVKGILYVGTKYANSVEQNNV